MTVQTSLLRLPQVVKLRGRSRSQTYVDIQAGTLTPPIAPRAGRQCSVWPSDEIEILIQAEIRGASDAELKALVQRLITQRMRAAVQVPKPLTREGPL